MAQDNPPARPARDPDPSIADAGLLFRDNRAASPPGPSAGAKPAGPAASGEVFDLADAESAEGGAPPVEPAPAAAKSKVPRPAPADSTKESPARKPSEMVEEVWTRQAEWGPTLIVVGAWVAFILLFVYFGLGSDYIWLGLLTLMLGAAAAAVLSYPILITLERPVRVTPEQALRDYYGALSHHLPHFRRMWLLLSSAGRISTAFGSFEGFKAYWRERLHQLRAGHAGSFTPLVFEVADFKADKSAGKDEIDTEFTLRVSVRGQRQAGPVHRFPMRIALVRGPDKMWYLENGTVSATPARRARSD
jgi:hypothetical protein